MQTRRTNVQPIQSTIDTTFEKHYSVQELVDLWGLSRNSICRAFENEPDVIRMNSKGIRPGTRRKLTLRIPESVARRVRARLIEKPPRV